MKNNWKSLIAGGCLALGYASVSTLSLVALIHSEKAYAQNNLSNTLKIEECHIDGIKAQVKCATLEVSENYQQPTGKKISLNAVILPAMDNSENKTPLFFLAGGPGQAASELASALNKRYSTIRNTRDIVLIDQRGTGKSNPLQCEDTVGMDVYSLAPEDFSAREVTNCLAEFNNDLSQFNTENAIRDFEQFRIALGYNKINIYGGSYGTRSGLTYLRMFPESLESAVLDSVGPIEVPIGTFGQSAARSFNLLLAHCIEDSACNTAYPNLRSEFDAVVERLAQSPQKVTIAHPRLGTPTEFVITTSKFIANLRMQLYSMHTRPLVPLIIHQAYLENYMPLAGLVAQMDQGMGMYVGLTFNIVCNEDIPRVTEQMLAQDADNNFGKADSHQGWLTACNIWPKYQPSADFTSPVTVDVPTLILSGNLDPVTPPSNGDYSDKTLAYSRHIVSQYDAHIVASSSCALKMIAGFLEDKSPEKVDATCLEERPKETFMTNLNGSL